MAIDERARHQLYLRLEEHLGAEAATTLMEHLPPTGWSEVAMKRDLDHLRAATKADLDHLRAATKADIDHVAEVTRLEIERLGDQLRGEIHKALTEQTRTVVLAAVLANSGAVITVAGLAFAAARLT
jgi:hypothetical protein